MILFYFNIPPLILGCLVGSSLWILNIPIVVDMVTSTTRINKDG